MPFNVVRLAKPDNIKRAVIVVVVPVRLRVAAYHARRSRNVATANGISDVILGALLVGVPFIKGAISDCRPISVSHMPRADCPTHRDPAALGFCPCVLAWDANIIAFAQHVILDFDWSRAIPARPNIAESVLFHCSPPIKERRAALHASDFMMARSLVENIPPRVGATHSALFVSSSTSAHASTARSSSPSRMAILTA